MGEAEPGVWGVGVCQQGPQGRLCLHAPSDQNKCRGPSPKLLNKQTNKRGGTWFNMVELEGGRTRGTEEKRRRVFDSDPVLIPIRLDRSCQKLTRAGDKHIVMWPFTMPGNKSTKSTRTRRLFIKNKKLHRGIKVDMFVLLAHKNVLF